MFLLVGVLFSCNEGTDEPPQTTEPPTGPTGPTPIEGIPVPLSEIQDSYGQISSFQFASQWGPYNSHDPSVIKDGEWYYSFGTDVAYGQPLSRVGIQVRRSRDLVAWEFRGWAFNGRPTQAVNYIRQNGGEPFENVWAPYIIKIGDEYRLYYSQSSPIFKLSAIGLLTSDNIEGPWEEKGLVVTSNTNIPMTNAIDPAVIVGKDGKHWMYYGSAFDGLYVMELNPETGLAQTTNDKGFRIIQRGFTGSRINGNIEAPEVIYNETTGYYYMFLSYDWLESKYNIRVGRSTSPTGPFLDFNGLDMNGEQDNGPMIVAPYRFQGHGGWQGVAHNAVFRDGDQFFIAHQGRPSTDRFYMIKHVRKIYWTEDGWPVASPQRFANLPSKQINREDIVGTWEQIILGYRVVPGYADEQFLPDLQVSADLTLNEDGTIGSDANNSWTFERPWLTLNYGNGAFIDKVYVDVEYDWENRRETIIYTGLNNEGTAIWGKKKQ
ncbi:arabinan endo-1,5-alpha-L-arabinosidase [Belliella buryatensis]|uniref:Arabinan endo-1,5-alpha-L-arabinosidase n=1 Tax=Belliella buryatensis TaxID=1500549 RepID=A0A239GHW1_9BACT|nr:arabinan endo-1,5-alpha-L-arabinosidase [Belliella buryatensis]SNS68777.1 arabinan endo-1,5-alpha-L-arabinosidase [Belliella buryatensis]